MSAHTPGPWLIRSTGAVGTDWMMTASIYPMEDEFPEENLANARLIAAAPELLDAAKSARDMFLAIASVGDDAGFDTSVFMATLTEIEVVIAKATGSAS